MLEGTWGQRLRPWQWEVYEDYRLEKTEDEPAGLLVNETGGVELRTLPDGRLFGIPVRIYEPLDNPNLVPELANVHRASDSSVLEFVSRWGFLGHGTLMRLEQPQGDRLSPTRPKVSSELKEPVAWFRAHARNVWLVVRMLIELEYMLGPATENGIDDAYIGEFLLPREKPNADWRIEYAAYLTDSTISVLFDGTVWGSPGMEVRTRELFGRAVSAVINSNLGSARPRLHSTPDATFTTELGFVSLLQAIYWHLANAAIGQTRYIQCHQCGRFSIRIHPRQRFCAPLQDQRDSRCAVEYNTQRIRRYRRTKKEHASTEAAGTSDVERNGGLING